MADQNAVADDNKEKNTVAKQAGMMALGGSAIAIIFAVLDAMPSQHHGTEKLILNIADILQHNKWPPELFMFILVTSGFSAGWLLAVIPLWKMITEWSFYLKALVLVTAIGIYGTFCYILNEKLPNFTLGSIPGFLVVWLLAVLLSLLIAAAYAIMSKAYGRIVSSYHQFKNCYLIFKSVRENIAFSS